MASDGLWPLLACHTTNRKVEAAAAAFPFQRPAQRETLNGASAMVAGTDLVVPVGTGDQQ